MALKTVQLGVRNTHKVATGMQIIRRAPMERRDSTKPFTGNDNMMSMTGGRSEQTGTYNPVSMPRPHIFIPYERNVRKSIV